MSFKSTSFILSFLMISVLVAQTPVSETYEHIAYAYPLSEITLDGNLDDWPEEAKPLPLSNTLWGAGLSSDVDLSAHFRAGYSLEENALFLALTITDDERIEHENPTWNNQDTYSLYVNEQHKLTGSGTVRYTVASNFKEATDPNQHWDPGLPALISWDKLAYRIKTVGNKTIIELRYTLQEPLEVGQVMGLGHMIVDQDQTESTVLGWVGRSGKSSSSQPGRIGAIVFANEQIRTGTLSGTVGSKDSLNLIPGHVSVTAANNSDRWFYLPVDESGQFSAVLPTGDWVLRVGANTFLRDEGYYRVSPEHSQPVTILPNQINTCAYVLKLDPEPDLLRKGNLLSDMNDVSRQKIDAAIEAYMEFYEIEGVSFAAWQHGEITHENTYGVKNNYTREKVTSETLFEVASITKPTFAFLVMRLYEQGVIDLDEPLYKHLAFDQIQHHEYSKLVTARHVLSHQTGFPNWARGQQIEFAFEPGKGYGYSGEGFEYLKRVIETITGKKINQLFQEELIEPLGLKHFYYQTHPYAIEHKSNGHYDGYPGTIDFPNEPGVAWSLVTTPVSYMEFANAIHQRKGLKPETYAMMLSRQNELPEEYQDRLPEVQEYVGLGWFIEETPYGKVIKHGGNNGDFMSEFKLYDDLGMAFMLTTNGYTGYLLSNEAESFLIDPEAMKKQFE